MSKRKNSLPSSRSKKRTSRKTHPTRKRRAASVQARRPSSTNHALSLTPHESDAWYRNLFEGTQDSIVVVDVQSGLIIDANPAACQVYGYSLTEFRRMPFWDLSAEPEATREAVYRGVTSVPTRKHRRKNGTEFSVEITGSYLQLGGKALHIAFIKDTTERAHTQESLRVSMEQLQNLRTKLEKVQEEERRSISREVHDELGQVLTALKMDLMSFRKQGWNDSRTMSEKLESALELTDSAIHAVQNISARLRPGMLDDLGILAAVEWQCEDFQKRTGIACVVNLPSRDITIDGDRSTALYRVLQEALTNITRHARARSVTVNLADREESYLFSIVDDGVGIEQAKVGDAQSLGLLGMRERLRPFGGTCTIGRGESGGTRVFIVLPKQ